MLLWPAVCAVAGLLQMGTVLAQTDQPAGAATDQPAGTAPDQPTAAAPPEPGLRPGEAVVTRFSGVTSADGPDGKPVLAIDVAGTVASIIDLRTPGHPPLGTHWIDEPQRAPVTASDVGQVFGVVLDDDTAPNVYLSATSAFGLHLSPGTQDWMPGMWGSGAGPGTIYRLDHANSYLPNILANVTLDGRPNSGPGLGNLAYDKYHKQLFVSDLETGMIHRIRTADGTDLGHYDHGVQGRPQFFDNENKKQGSLPPISFDPSTHARISDCPSGAFERSPECWNFAATGRRVWGVGFRHFPGNNQDRLFYAVWSSPAFNQTAWNAASADDKRNSVWSIRIAPDGSFDTSDVKREFVVPDFFVKPDDIARAGYSQPVSDISFALCSERPIMLIAERGGIRNLGLDAENPFAFPHEARALRYELDQTGAWRPVGRYDVGFYDRKNDGQPYIRANCSGGIAFGPGYTDAWTADLAKPDQFVWITGDYLCSPDGPCHWPGAEQAAAQPTPGAQPAPQPANAEAEIQRDESQVHGLEGLAEGAFDEIMPAGALAAYPASGEPYPSAGLDKSYLIDTDINIDADGKVIEAELTRNDATKIGDVAIYEVCARAPGPAPAAMLLPPPPAEEEPPDLVLDGHSREITHAMVASHGTDMSHYRWGSHNPYWSHSRFRSHNPYWSHNRFRSHNAFWSHSRLGSHNRDMSHRRSGSHMLYISHFRGRSHNERISHDRAGSHKREASHSRRGSHNTRISIAHKPAGSHTVAQSGTRAHKPQGSHTVALSSTTHKPAGSHTTALSATHSTDASRKVHSTEQSKTTTPSHTTAESRAHSTAASKASTHTPTGSHSTDQSKASTHTPTGSHSTDQSKASTLTPAGSHSTDQSKASTHTPAGSHSTDESKARKHTPTESHSTDQSKASTHTPPGSHATALSKGSTHTPPGSHTTALSKARTHTPPGSHSTAVSQRRTTKSTTFRQKTNFHRTTTVHHTTVHQTFVRRQPTPHFAPVRRGRH